jgi:uncharacterized membrane protein YkvA (DUF1232 family)
VLHFLELLVIVGGILALAFMILLALPQSRLRDLLMPFISWAFVVLCGVYVISPVDIMPEIILGPAGIFDDFAAGVAGVLTAMSTIKAQRQKKAAAYNDPYFNN